MEGEDLRLSHWRIFGYMRAKEPKPKPEEGFQSERAVLVIHDTNRFFDFLWSRSWCVLISQRNLFATVGTVGITESPSLRPSKMQ